MEGTRPSRAPMGLPKGRGNMANFVPEMIVEAEPETVTLIAVSTFCLTLSESAQGGQRSLNWARIFDRLGRNTHHCLRDK